MKKRLLFYLITLISTSFFLVLQVIDPAIIREHIESKTYDLRLHLRNLIKKQSPLENIVIVAVDEKSIKKIGRWPWNRDVMAGLVSRISEGKPKVIGVDIMYTEEESKESDDKLAAAFKEAGNVVLAMPFFVSENKKNITVGEVPDFMWDSAFMEVKSQKWIKWKDWAAKAEDVNPPLKKFAEVTKLAHVYTQPDMDGITRWEILSVNYGDDCYPQLSLQMARIALGLEMKDMVLFGGSGIKLGNVFIHTTLGGKTLINYIGREYSFPYKSASDVMDNKIPPAFFNDKIVFIGTSALATYDLKNTPFSGNMPGVEKNATVLQNILLNNFLRKSPGVMEVLVILVSGIFLGFVLPRLKAIASSSLAIVSIMFYISLGSYLLIYNDLWINLLYPVSNMFSIFTVQTVMRFFYEEKKAKDIRKMFSSYVSPKIVEILINDPEKAGIGGVRREVTVLFSDIRGFTSISETHSPEEVVEILNEYLGEMTDIVFKWEGTLDKFIGDAILAFWGAPVIQDKHAEMAAKCALNMTARLDELQKKWAAEGKPRLNIGIGINTGEVVVGNIGAVGKKMDYTVIGDPVNLASRVESLTKKYGVRILITEFTLDKARGPIEAGALGHVSVTGKEKVIVKGKKKPVGIFELTSLDHSSKSMIVECEDRVVELKEK